MRIGSLALVALGVVGCSSASADAPAPAAEEPSGARARMDFTLAGGFYAAPFPSDARCRAGGTVDFAAFPSPSGAKIEGQILDLAAHAGCGFGRTTGVFVAFDAALDPARLPDLAGSVAPGAAVFVVSVDPAAADYGRRYPVLARFSPDGGPFGAPNLLALLPLQGAPLAAHTRYAAVVSRDLRDAEGKRLGVAPELADLVAGRRPAGLSDAAFAEHQAVLASLAALGVEGAGLAALAAFTTGDPTAEVGRVLADILSRPVPTAKSPFVRREVFDDYCVYASTIDMPDYQDGTPPYSDAGGGWRFDPAGKPIVQRQAEANFVVTVPRRAMPAAGFPAVVFSRTGGGGERPLVDRGVQGVHDGPPLVAGSGPALDFAQVGFAGATIDGPLGGLRNVTHADEQFLIFNVANPTALRDNVRQSAVELALAAHVLAQTTLDASDCPGVDAASAARVRFDGGTLALMGHSMGATIAPLALAFEPMLRAAVLSGAGGSYIANIIDKQSPLAVKPIAEVLLGLSSTGYHLHVHDPLLSLMQWVVESSDPPVYAERVVRAPVDAPPRHVLMMQGIVDTYILPSIAYPVSLSLGLDLAGPERDRDDPRLAAFTPVGELLPLVGRQAIALPASGNLTVGGARVTAVLTQNLGDGIEDGHEVVFQTEAPKHQYRCFLADLAAGVVPRVPAEGAEHDPCP